jgi:glycopeptide antibiotics resistance protein
MFLPLLGELVQIALAKTFPSISYFWFSFELIDVVSNTIGSLVGIGVARVMSFLKGCLPF